MIVVVIVLTRIRIINYNLLFLLIKKKSGINTRDNSRKKLVLVKTSSPIRQRIVKKRNYNILKKKNVRKI